jgi:hypothetical protein
MSERKMVRCSNSKVTFSLFENKAEINNFNFLIKQIFGELLNKDNISVLQNPDFPGLLLVFVENFAR